MEISQLLKSRATMVMLGLALAAVAFVTFELYMQKRDVDSEVARLGAQADRLSGENRSLDELIKYMGTPDFAEREAREKLNLKRPGEEVVFLPSDAEAVQVAGAGQEGRSNPAKWFDYFFASK